MKRISSRSIVYGAVALAVVLAALNTPSPGFPAGAKEEAVILTPAPSPSPRVNGPRVFGARPGSPFLYRIPATGERPMAYSAENLPAGLSLDPATGIITGAIAERGEYAVTLKAANRLGAAERDLKLVCGDTLALTPHLGWNSWYVWENHVTDAIMRAAADAMVETGLADHGFMYVNIDDCWAMKPGTDDPTLQGEPRDKSGKVNSNPRFPDMKALTDHIHAKGLKAGIYTSPGPLTCAGHIGSLRTRGPGRRAVRRMGLRFPEVRLVFLRQDRRGQEPRGIPETLPVDQRDPERTAAGHRPQPLPIRHGRRLGLGKGGRGNSWRTAGDLGGSFEKIGEALFRDGFDLYAEKSLEDHGGPGGWNDPDYLLIGYLSNWKGATVPTPLTPNEQYAHVSLWCLLAAPLILSGDITRLDDFTLGLLTNDEVIDVDQDPLGRPGRRVAKNGSLEVWSRPMEDGSLAVGLFNRGEGLKAVEANWQDLGLRGPQRVRDLWRQRDVGVTDGKFEAAVGRHGVVLVRMWPAAPAAETE